MSSHASTKIDQKEYLKRYLSGDKEKKKKKKDKHKHKKSVTSAKVRIIDDDAVGYRDKQELDEELLLGGEDAPQIVAEYIEERPNDLKKWRSIAVKDEPPEGAIGTVSGLKREKTDENEMWGRQTTDLKKIRDEFSPTRTKKRTPDRRKKDRDNSPSKKSNRDSYKSPPRRSTVKIKEEPSSSPEQDRGDQSPPRRRRAESRDQSPARRNRDQSPPRRSKRSPPRKHRNSNDVSQPRRTRSERSNDQSPPRRRRDKSSDQSPPRRKIKNSPTDLSPPRRRINSSSDQSPPRRRRRGASPDQSPPRRKQDQSSGSSLKRKLRDSPPGKRNRSGSPRRRHSRDQSPPRSNIKKERQSSSPTLPPARKSRWAKPEPVNSPSPPPTHKPKSTKTLDGKKAGLQDAHSLKAETFERRKQEERMFAEMSRDISGRDAEVQVRNTGRRGQRARDAAAEDPEKQRLKEEREQKKKELYDRWGKGLKQIEQQEKRFAEMSHEAAKPLARYANDEDLDRHLREREHADDPMLAYVREKRKRKQETNTPKMPIYEGSFPENRFGIRPGYRWDGVDRSNGYEKKWFDVQNSKKALQDEAYKYSVEDM